MEHVNAANERAHCRREVSMHMHGIARTCIASQMHRISSRCVFARALSIPTLAANAGMAGDDEVEEERGRGVNIRRHSCSSCSRGGRRESGALPDGYVMTERGVLRPGAEEESTTSSLTIEDKEQPEPVRRQAAVITSSVLTDVKAAALAARVALTGVAEQAKSSATKAETAAIKSPNTLGVVGGAGTVSGRDSPVPPRPVSPGAARPRSSPYRRGPMCRSRLQRQRQRRSPQPLL